MKHLQVKLCKTGVVKERVAAGGGGGASAAASLFQMGQTRTVGASGALVSELLF